MTDKGDRNENGGLARSMADIIKRDWKTIPNILCYFRICMIPFFIHLYIAKKSYYMAAALIVLSAFTDIMDGFIARNFNMVSDLGKALDPAADKLTQFSVFLCLSSRFKAAWILVAVIVIREISLLALGTLVFKYTGKVNSAMWYGKMATVITETTAMILILVPGMNMNAATTLLYVSTAGALFSFVMYVRRYNHLILEHLREKN